MSRNWQRWLATQDEHVSSWQSRSSLRLFSTDSLTIFDFVSILRPSQTVVTQAGASHLPSHSTRQTRQEAFGGRFGWKQRRGILMLLRSQSSRIVSPFFASSFLPLTVTVMLRKMLLVEADAVASIYKKYWSYRDGLISESILRGSKTMKKNLKTSNINPDMIV